MGDGRFPVVLQGLLKSLEKAPVASNAASYFICKHFMNISAQLMGMCLSPESRICIALNQKLKPEEVIFLEYVNYNMNM